MHSTGFPGTRGQHHPGPCLETDDRCPGVGSAAAEFAQGCHRAPVTENKENQKSTLYDVKRKCEKKNTVLLSTLAQKIH